MKSIHPLLRALVLFVCAFAVLLPSGEADARRKKKKRKTPDQYVILDGIRERVNWNDGDSFRVLEGPNKDTKARIMGYNTLESYGPVHFWGGFHGYELYDIAKAGTKLARGTEWECESVGDKDGYGRILVKCPKLTEAIIRAGYAHLFAIDDPPDPELVRIQLDAQRRRAGIWSKGIPSEIVTSIHSTDENKDGKKTSYNRICNTQTGMSSVITHETAFKPCDAWCHGGSCMLYVPFEIRFGDKRPECMRRGRDLRVSPPAHVGNPLKPRG